MSHKPNLLSWDQDVAASPREFHETDNNRTNSAALLAGYQSFRTHGLFVPRRFVPRLRRFVPTFGHFRTQPSGRFVPNQIMTQNV